MKLRAWWRGRSTVERWALGLGAGVAALALVRRRPEVATPVVVLGPPAPADVMLGWAELVGSPIVLEPGRRYRACVRLGWLVEKVATDSLVRSKLEEAGFRDVWIGRDVPGCDRAIEATYAGARTAKDRPAQLARAWELRPL